MMRGCAGWSSSLRRALLGGCIGLLLGCVERGGDRLPIGGERAGRITEEAAGGAERIAVGEDTIRIEGMAELIQVDEIRSPAGFSLPFRTEVPADLATEFVSSGEGDAIRFEAEFGGLRRPEAALVFMVPLVTADSAAASRWAAESAAGLGAERLPEPIHSWAREEYRIAGSELGFLAVGSHAGRWFYFLARYPAEYADGMAPRLDLVFRRWRWADGSPLMNP